MRSTGLPNWSAFADEDLADLDEGARAVSRERAIPSPEHVIRDPQQLTDQRRYNLPTGHWPQFTRPEELGRAILASTVTGL